MVAQETENFSEESPQIQETERFLLSELLGNAHAAVSIFSHQTIRLIDGELFLYDEQDQSITSLGFYSEMDAAILPSQEILLTLDGNLYLLQEKELQPLSLSLPPISRLHRYQEQVWLWGDGRLFYWEDSQIVEVSLDDDSFIFDFAITDDHIYLTTPWLIKLERGAAGLEVQKKWELLIQDIVFETETETIWLLDDSQKLYSMYQDSLLLQTPPEQINSLFGPDLWFSGETSVWQVRGQVWSAHDISANNILDIDLHGRLLQNIDGELWRHSIGRPVIVVGLSENLMVQETIRLLPSDPDSVHSLRVWVDSTELEVSVDHTITLNPDEYETGEHELRFFCESDLGDTISNQAFWVGELPEVLWEEVELISQEHCLSCHNGYTITTLETKDQWVRHIEAIIDEVSQESMPLGGPYLSEDEIMKIRGWKQGGFQ